MGGGNETPRQKMVGMMYLVLTALLALNVSKSILDAFVAIEENIQISMETEYLRGEEKKAALKEVAQDKSAPAVAVKAAAYLKDVDKIDKMTAEMVKMIDDIKIQALKDCQEKMELKGEEAIVAKAYDTKEPCRPTRMHLAHVEANDKYDEPMHLIIGPETNIKKPDGEGIKLWNAYIKFRADLVELLVKSASTPEKKFSLKTTAINTYKDSEDLNKQVDKMLAKGKVSPDELGEVKKIYEALTKNELHEMHGETGVHWVGKTFDHSPIVAAIASLSSVEKEILTARADAISLIRSRVGGGEYSFNKIVAIANGPLLANSGDEVEISVIMAAFDSDKQPEVTAKGGKLKEVKDGQGIVTATVSGSGEMKLSGDIAITNKSGAKKSMPWEHTIKIMKPEGTVSLPDMQVLYQGYANKVTGVASGYDQTILNAGAGLSLTKSGAMWIATPNGGVKSVDISISGKSSVTNKTVSLGKFTFKVKPLPPAAIYFAGKGTGETAPKTAMGLSAKFPPSVDLTGVNFRVLDWKMEFAGKTMAGQGDVISAAASGLLKQAKPGQSATFICKYSDGKSSPKYGACVVTLN